MVSERGQFPDGAAPVLCYYNSKQNIGTHVRTQLESPGNRSLGSRVTEGIPLPTEGADLRLSRDNRWFASWLVLVVVWALACPASTSASIAACACCGPAEAPADDCCAGEKTSANCEDAIGDCCLMAAIGEASRYAVLPAIDRTIGKAAKSSAPAHDLAGLSGAPGLAGSLHASVLAIAPPPRPGVLANSATRETDHPSPPTHLLYSVFLR